MSRARMLAIATFAAYATLPMLAAQAQTFKMLYDFKSEPDGALPAGGLTAHAGTLYGTTNSGGTSDNGAVYAVDAISGAETVLYSFAGAFNGSTDGSAPGGELLYRNGALYGTTSFGGKFNAGTVFKVDAATGAETVLYSFGASSTDGTTPSAGLIYDYGKFYGTTTLGGAANLGTVFAVDASTGIETILHSFAGGRDGAQPFAPLVLHDGVLYGTTFFGGPSNIGTVFKVDAKTGAETVLHAFKGSSFEANPAAGLTFRNGVLYGTTSHGGLINRCGAGGCGTVFEVDPYTGAEAVLYAFKNRGEGEDPEGGLVFQGGFLYGTTETGGHVGLGTVFRLDPATQAFTLLHHFRGAPDGQNPLTLIYHHGQLYGTTREGGGAGFGTVFKLNP